MTTCWGYFTDDLVLQVLPLLPSKSQARFRSVSKQWRSLISNDPRHVRGLSLHLLPLDTTLCNHQYLSLTFRRHRFELLQSCNGLLLLGRQVQIQFRDTTEFHIYNPLTRQQCTLPLCTCCLHSSRHVHVTASLAYDPSRSPHYKLLCLCHYHIMIYSSRTSSWTCWANSTFERRLKAIVNPYNDHIKTPVYWHTSVYYISDADRDLYKLYRFDVDREVMIRTKLPYRGFEACRVKHLVESWGCLYMLASLGEQQLWVYEMESDRSGWRLKHRLDDFGRDLKIRFRQYYGNDLEIRLAGREIFVAPSGRWEVFFPTAESGGEEELWLVILDVQLVYRYGLGSKCVVVVKARHHGHHRHHGDDPYWGIKAHEFAESILELPRRLA